ncbi:hypothetical protein QF035_000042 [Streptomyces umbrinus]|uniref:Uncharacterized protein n=1 Tax=Streptomyces umbrinus TaxID=67370 RepID=A0ABU0SFX4_9ACTN|nr:hypothetical protein [Streptomyces umbrinus]MDQ1022460.1 hypothetical protein [Streptomyces umbrinus]
MTDEPAPTEEDIRMGFIADKTAELRAAVQAGDSGRAAEVITETVLENDRPFEETIADMTATDRRQHG